MNALKGCDLGGRCTRQRPKLLSDFAMDAESEPQRGRAAAIGNLPGVAVANPDGTQLLDKGERFALHVAIFAECKADRKRNSLHSV